MHNTKPIVKIFFTAIVLFFIAFLLLPLSVLFIRSLETDHGFSTMNYINMLANEELLISIRNSFVVSTATAIITTILAFTLAYSVHNTRIYTPIKQLIRIGILIPMLLPTITYGFAIMYSFGNQGLITKLVGSNLFEIYGFNGLLIGYVIYTIPPAFLLISNSFQYIDKKFIIVSKLMGDRPIRSFFHTVLRPLIGTIGGAFVLSFILSFTDFGIPASIGGTYNVVATQLYQVMLGSIPNFNNGAVIAIFMLLPAVLGVLLLTYLEKFHFQYDKFTNINMFSGKTRDLCFGTISSLIVLSIFSIFIVMFIAPFVKSYPYDLTFSWQHLIATYEKSNLMNVYTNSLIVAFFTAFAGTFTSYCAALINVRTTLQGRFLLDTISIITNTIPGMVLGLSYLLFFNGSNLKGTFTIIIINTIVHYFTTPFLMAKNSLSKMTLSWETTSELLGDHWIKTIRRVIVPNSLNTIYEMFSYYFINAMVTISGIIFLVTAKTSGMASKIKELQHFAKFNEIFILSIFIFATNLLIKLLFDYLQKRQSIHR